MDVIDVDSPERGWEPFLDWLRVHDLDPTLVREVRVDGATLAGEVVVYRTRGGKKYVTSVDGEEVVATRVEAVTFTEAPPRIVAL